MDAHPKVVQLAQALSELSWRPLERLPQYEIWTEPRLRPERVKEQIVVQKGYLNKKLVAESVSDMTYQPAKCQQKYRLVILRKNISVPKGEQVIFDEVRYFFYLTNRWDLSKEQIVGLANGRCDQENVIEQLKNGVNAMRMRSFVVAKLGTRMLPGSASLQCYIQESCFLGNIFLADRVKVVRCQGFQATLHSPFAFLFGCGSAALCLRVKLLYGAGFAGAVAGGGWAGDCGGVHSLYSPGTSKIDWSTGSSLAETSVMVMV